MRHYRPFAVLIFFTFAISCATVRTAAAPELAPLGITPAKADQPISLRDRLVVGLQARLNTEIAFCDTVAARVRGGQLPQRLVDETFFWARLRAGSIRNGHKYRPIVYFQPAMRARAKLLDLTL